MPVAESDERSERSVSEVIPLPAPIKTKNAPFTGAFFVLKVGGDRLRTHEGSGIERSEDEQALPERQCRAPSHCPLQFFK